MSANLIEKLHPARFSEMSPLMAAIVGYVLGESFTDPTIAELTKGFKASKTCGTTGTCCWMQQN